MFYLLSTFMLVTLFFSFPTLFFSVILVHPRFLNSTHVLRQKRVFKLERGETVAMCRNMVYSLSYFC